MDFPAGFDTSHPSIRFYLTLIRLQVLTPLSLLLNIAAVLTCTLIPNQQAIQDVSSRYPTALTPDAKIIAAYVALGWLGQVGYCVLLVGARKEETKKAMVSAVGVALVGANVAMGAWAVAFIMQWFLFSAILQGIMLLLLLFSNIALLIYHPPSSSRPLDTALIHAPLRFFLLLPMSILFPLSIFISLNLTYDPESSPGSLSYHSTLPAFLVLLGTNLLGLLVVSIRGDIVWCVAMTWLNVSLWVAKPKPANVYSTAITFTALLPLALILSLMYTWLFIGRRQNRRIILRGDERALYSEEGHVNGEGQARAQGPPNSVQGMETGPREIDNENWG